jgi:hypothetical protein
MSDRLTRAALTWAERGWHVFPCAPGGKPPAIPDADWHDLATTSPRQIRDWWAMRPYNIGIDCGLSGLVVVDLDIPGHGRRVPGEIPDRRTGLDTLIRLCGEQGRPVPNPTFTAATPSGGMHLYYSAADIPVGSSKERLGPLIDVRATGGYVIAPGSYRDGGYYTVLNPGPLEPLPSWLAQLHGKPQPPPASVHLTLAAGSRNGSAYAKAALDGEVTSVATARDYPDSALNRSAFSLGQLVAAGLLAESDVIRELSAAAANSGLREREISRVIRRGLTAGERYPRQVPDRTPLVEFRIPAQHEPGQAPRH